MNGGVPCVQFDCDVDEHLFLNGWHRPLCDPLWIRLTTLTRFSA